MGIQVMALATGETRPITQVGDDGAFSCPWCGGYCPPGATRCPNPMCWASPFFTAEQIRAKQAERARVEREHQDRIRREELAAERAQAVRDADNRRWADLTERASTQGACLTCLRRSQWRTSPRFVVHRRADFHGAVTR